MTRTLRTTLPCLASLLTLVAGTNAAPALQNAQSTPASTPATAPATAPAMAPALGYRDRGQAAIARAIEYLRRTQDKATGGWSVPEKGSPMPNLPAITGLVLNGMLLQPGIDSADPAVANGARYILSFARPDGGIYDTILPSYNTAITLSALARMNTPQARAAIAPAQEFLKRSQWGTTEPVGVGGAGGKEAPSTVEPSHPHYGGLGYGNRGRPDISNLAFALQAWHDSGLPSDDPAFQRAVIFLQRMQMAEKDPTGKVINDMPYAKGSQQGGFIYATSENDKTVGQGNSFAGRIDETLTTGERVSMLRAYGSVTYAGFKSYIYAGLTRNDPRVVLAHRWMQQNWSMRENPGIGTDGFYYYVLMMSRALDATAEPAIAVSAFAQPRNSLVLRDVPASVTHEQVRAAVAALRKNADDPDVGVLLDIPTAAPSGGSPASGSRDIILYTAKDDQATPLMALIGPGGSLKVGDTPLRVHTAENAWATEGTVTIDWRQAIVERLVALQNPDGSFKALDDRWMENNPVLITAYGLIALQHAVGNSGPVKPK